MNFNTPSKFQLFPHHRKGQKVRAPAARREMSREFPLVNSGSIPDNYNVQLRFIELSIINHNYFFFTILHFTLNTAS